jgi:hypothetical protein
MAALTTDVLATNVTLTRSVTGWNDIRWEEMNTDVETYFTILNVSGNDENELALTGFSYSYLLLQTDPFIMRLLTFIVHQTEGTMIVQIRSYIWQCLS